MSKRHKSSTGLSSDDMRLLNTAIGKLYRHLQLNQREQEVTSSEIMFKEPTQKENINILTLSQVQPEESFHDIVLKLRNFEKEFQRQKVQQQKELMRLQEEIKRLNKNSVELRRENERMKGVQPIVTKAKGKHVERIEERHRTEKRGMEEKINELETGMRRNFAQLLQDREGMRSTIKSDVDNLTSSINNVHHIALGYYYDTPTTVHSRSADEQDLLQTKDLLNMLKSLTDGVQKLKSKNRELTTQAEEMKSWRRGLKEIDREIGRFSQNFSDDDDFESSILHHDADATDIVSSCKTKLDKTNDNINERLKNIGDAASVIKRKERDLSKYRRNLKELQNEIAKLHDQVISVQNEDISISMPEFERRHEERSEGSADELPEADRQDQNDLLDKLKQIGTMVTHFQQLIIDRTSILNKMENDMLPLKIRVNRLHEEVSRAMTSSESPDPADDTLRSKRSLSPEMQYNTISREIANMLTKLSKMEMTIRHLLETYATDPGRATI